ncbi:MAG: PKD domain-containing protein [Nitrosomonadales bacterium]|nr:PKD domain-containing protein [Nitrosomonadales bacterium]
MNHLLIKPVAQPGTVAARIVLSILSCCAFVPASVAEPSLPATSGATPPSSSTDSGNCSTTGDTGAITLSSVAARLNGVAPLAVFFDATGTTATATTRPFHELEYRWGFGDPLGSPVSGTTWNTGSNPGVSSRNTATGPVAAHVYEIPGTYTVTLNVTDGKNTVSNSCTRIVVQDPDVVFPGTKTACVGAADPPPVPGTGGCPAGASAVVQPNFTAAISTHARTGKRVLFRKGDTFTMQVKAEILQTGPGIVGSFGSGPLPVIRTTATSDATLSFSGRTTPTFSDWRVMDLEFDGGGGSVIHGVGAFGGITQITLLRLTMRNFEAALGLDGTMANYWNNYPGGGSGTKGHLADQLAIVDATVLYGSNTHYGVYGSGNRYAFMGNYVDNGGLNLSLGHPINGSHIARFPYLGKAVISNNDLLRPGFDRLGIKLHGPTWTGSAAGAGGTPSSTGEANWSNYSAAVSGDGYSKQIVISDNKLTDFRNPWSIAVGPQNASSDERVREVILERNLHVGSPLSQVAHVIRAREVTIRNNLYIGNADSTSKYQAGVRIEVDGPEPPARNIWVYNNTQYSAAALPSGQFLMVDIKHTPNIIINGNNNNSPSSITVKNNLAFAPNAASPLLYKNTGIDAAMNVVVSSNSTNAQVKNGGRAPLAVPLSMPLTSPPFIVPPSFLVNFVPAAGSYAINGGAIVPVWSDFFRNDRPQKAIMDMGAAEAP